MMEEQTVSRGELARKIYDLSHLTGEFKLRGGATSHEYFDKYLFEADPATLRAVSRALKPLLPEGAEVLAGLETGGIPIAVMLSQETGLPTCFVRKKAKDYGTAKLAEGADVRGKKVVMVEDVVTSGGQVLLSAADLRAAGAEIIGVLCVIDREAGGPEKMEEKDLNLRSLFTMSELKDAAA